MNCLYRLQGTHQSAKLGRPALVVALKDIDSVDALAWPRAFECEISEQSPRATRLPSRYAAPFHPLLALLGSRGCELWR